MITTEWLSDFNRRPTGTVFELHAAEIILRQAALLDEMGHRIDDMAAVLRKLAECPVYRKVIEESGVMG